MSNYKNVIKYCLQCDKKLKLNNNRDIQRKNFCSKYCSGLYNSSKTKKYLPHKHGDMSSNWRGGISKNIKNCKICGKKVNYANKNNLCKSCFNHNKRKEKIILECCVCHKIKFLLPYQHKINISKTCSKECYYIWIKEHGSRIETICLNCGKKIIKFRTLLVGKNSFCSRKCNSIFYSNLNKEHSIFYIDGRTTLRKKLKRCYRWRDWRNFIYERDHFKCCDCNSTIKLHAHHIKLFSSLFTEFLTFYPELDLKKDKDVLYQLAINSDFLWDTKNGITLCEECHQKKHPDVHLNDRINKEI